MRLTTARQAAAGETRTTTTQTAAPAPAATTLGRARGALLATALVGALGACAASAADPQTYAEAALREDAREAALDAAPAADDERVGLDTAGVARALGRPGRLRGGMYLVELRRAATERTPGGAYATIALHPALSGRAALTGDVTLAAAAAPAVGRALSAHGIRVTATTPDPRAENRAVLQVWALGDPVVLAAGLGAALNADAGEVATTVGSR